MVTFCLFVLNWIITCDPRRYGSSRATALNQRVVLFHMTFPSPIPGRHRPQKPTGYYWVILMGLTYLLLFPRSAKRRYGVRKEQKKEQRTYVQRANEKCVHSQRGPGLPSSRSSPWHLPSAAALPHPVPPTPPRAPEPPFSRPSSPAGRSGQPGSLAHPGRAI